MKVREAIAELSQLNDDLEIADEYGQHTLTGFYVSGYVTTDGPHEYVAYSTRETDN